MIKLTEINKSINNTIKNALIDTEFATVPIVAEDLSEPIIRPSFKIGIENSSNGKFNLNCREKTLTVRVYFFSSDVRKYKIENMKMQDLIENAFLNGLEITEEFYVPIEEVESEISDTVLICSFDLYMVEDLVDIDPNEFMEELNLEV